MRDAVPVRSVRGFILSMVISATLWLMALAAAAISLR